MKPFSDFCPKPLLPTLGIPTAFYSMASLYAEGIREFVVNFHHLPDLAKKGFQEFTQIFPDSRLVFSDETALLMGSGGGYKKAAPWFLGEPLLSCNGDVLSAGSVSNLWQAHHAGQNLLTLALARSSPRAYTEIRVHQNQVVGLEPPKTGTPFFTGWSVLNPEVLQGLSDTEPSDFVAQILRPLMTQKKVGFTWFEGPWFDVGNPQAWATTHFDLMEWLNLHGITPAWQKLFDFYQIKKIDRSTWECRGGYFNSKQQTVDYGSSQIPHTLTYGGVRVDLKSGQN